MPIYDARTLRRMEDIAEDVNGVPSTIDIINQLRKGELLFETVERVSSTEYNAITAYIDDIDGSPIEWKSISLIASIV